MFQTDVFNNQWCDIVFENREKNYGAYMLRKRDARNTFIAFFLSSIFFISIASIPMIMQWLKPNVIEIKDPPLVVDSNFLIEVLPKTKPPVKLKVEEKIPTKTLKQTLKFTHPVIVDQNPDDFPPQDKLNTTVAGNETNKDTAASVPNETNKIGTIHIDKPDSVYSVWAIQQEPEFPGGKQALLQYLANNIKYTPQAREMNVSGKVFISFVVDKEGKVIDADIIRGIGAGLDQVALNAVNAMPKWKPGKANGNPVSVRYALPVTFTIK